MEVAYRCLDSVYMGLLQLLHVFSSSKIEGIGLFTCIGYKWQSFGTELSHSGHSQVQKVTVHPVQPQLSLSGTMVLYVGKHTIKEE